MSIYWSERIALFRHRSFLLLLAARTASFLGTTVATVAVPFAALKVGGSASSVGIVAAAFGLRRVVLLLAGGVVADRFPRKRPMVIAGVAATFAQGLTALLLLTGHLGMPVLAALQAVNGAAFAFSTRRPSP